MILFLDSNIVIYVVEGNPAFAPKVLLRLAIAQSAGDSFMISDLTRMECLVGPIKTNNAAVQASFLAFFARSDVWVGAVTAAVCDRTARIRPIGIVFHPVEMSGLVPKMNREPRVLKFESCHEPERY